MYVALGSKIIPTEALPSVTAMLAEPDAKTSPHAGRGHFSVWLPAK